jgi:amidase
MIRLMLLSALLPLPALAAQDTVRFTPTVQQPTFAVRPPVLRIRPGTVLVSRTHFGPYYTEAGGAFPGEVGPIYVEGATTKDMLRVNIVKVRPNHGLAASQVYSDFGGLATDTRVRLLNEPIPARRYVWRLDTTRMVGVTEMPKSRVKRLEIYFGDGHARHGDGEVAGTGLETSMDVVLKIDVVKGRTIDWPRLEDAEHIMVVGSGRPLIDAFRLAHVELVEWLEQDYGFERLDAYTLVGQVGESTVANIVDPAYSVVAKIRKRYLGAAR